MDPKVIEKSFANFPGFAHGKTLSSRKNSVTQNQFDEKNLIKETCQKRKVGAGIKGRRPRGGTAYVLLLE